jgi:hypothetical protein
MRREGEVERTRGLAEWNSSFLGVINSVVLDASSIIIPVNVPNYSSSLEQILSNVLFDKIKVQSVCTVPTPVAVLRKWRLFPLLNL